MVTSQLAYTIFIALLAAERLVELLLSRRNAAWALASGGVEYGQRHFRWMKLLHSVFFVGCLAEVYLLRRPFVPLLAGSMFAAALAAQGLRYWAIGTLGQRWNVRVIVLPGQPPVTGGPYRLLGHPNYLAVVIEGFAVPLVHGAWITALVFSALGGLLLAVRIRCEERALSEHSDYSARFGGLWRLVPGSRFGGRKQGVRL